MDNRRISVIIVSYNNQDVIEDCLCSLWDQNDIGEDLEVIVVEQSDTDQIYQALTEKFPDFTILRAENRGFGAGNNTGAEKATGDILFFLNPDTVLVEPVFGFVREQFQKDATLGLAGLHLTGKNGENISYNMLFPYGLKPRLTHVLCRKMDRFLSKKMYIEGADLIFRREAFEKAGKFDEAIFMYGEEADLCHRLHRTGYSVRYFPDKKIRHLQGSCTPDRYPKVFGKQLQSFLYICRKNGFDGPKWLRRELRYQKFIYRIMRLLGRKESAILAADLAKALRDAESGGTTDLRAPGSLRRNSDE